MTGHEARALLRASEWPGYGQDEQHALGVLVCDIHEMLEHCCNLWASYEQVERGETIPLQTGNTTGDSCSLGKH